MAVEPKFTAGQTVVSAKLALSAIAQGRYRVVRLLPADGAGNQYRIKSVLDGHERVMREGDLTLS